MSKKTESKTVVLDRPYVLHGVIYPAGEATIPTAHLESGDLSPSLLACVQSTDSPQAVEVVMSKPATTTEKKS